MEIEDMLERLRIYEARRRADNNINPPRIINPEIPRPPNGQAMPPPSLSEAKINRYKSKPIEFQMNPKFAGIPDITNNMKRVTFTFNDDKYINEPTILMARIENVYDICTIGRAVIPMMANGFSEYGVGAIFLLAYHLHDPANAGYYLFPQVYGNVDDVVLEELSTTVFKPISTSVTLGGIADVVLEARAYSYLAASMLRLFTKSEENYVSAFAYILNGFKTFYGTPFPIAVTPPDVWALRTFTRLIRNGRIFKMSLYKILYAGGTSSNGERMRGFLYEMHLANTGLHIVSIFIKLCIAMNCKPDFLLSIIYTKEFERQTDALMHMLLLITDDSENKQRKMWRYGRIFDDSFMATLQTKNIAFLVYVLAAALKLGGAKSNEGIMKIVHFSEINPDRKRKGDAIAEKLVALVRGHLAKDSGIMLNHV